MQRREVGRSIFITMIGQLVLYGQGLIVMPIIIKLSGAATYGAYVLIGSMLATVYGLSSLGAGYNFRRKLASTHDASARRALFEPQFTFQFVNLAWISALIILGGSALQRALFGPEIQVAAWILPLWLAAYFIYSQAADYFRYSMRFVHFNLIGLYPALFVVAVSLLAAATKTISLNALILLQAIIYAAVTAPLAFILLREIGGLRPRLPVQRILSDVKVGYPLTLEFLVDLLFAYGDRYLILAFLAVSDVGYYQPAYQLGALVIFFPKIAGVVLPAALSRLVDSGSESDARQISSRFLRLYLMIAIPFTVGAFMVGPSFVALLTSPDVAYPSRWVCGLIAAATIFNGISLIGFQVAFVLGRNKTLLLANICAVALNLVMNAILLAMYRNITVPAIVSLVSYLASFLYLSWFLRDRWPLSVDKQSLFHFALSGACLAAMLYFVGYAPGAIVSVSAGQLVLHIMLGIAIYFGALLLVGALGRREADEIKALFQRQPKPMPSEIAIAIGEGRNLSDEP